MDDQDDAPKTLGPGWAHLFLRDNRSAKDRQIAEFNERKRRSGSRKRWHDYHPEDAANDPPKD